MRTTIHIVLFLSVLFPLFSSSLYADLDEIMPEGVMATRGKGTVTRQMFDAKVSRIPVKDRAGVLRDAERVRKILASVLLNSQLVADAVEDGFDKGDVQFRMQLAAETELARAWLDYYVESQPDADYLAMAHEYYLLNQEIFETEPSRDVSHLLVSNENRSPEETTELAQSYLEQILLNPDIFDQLIMDHSEDSSVNSNHGHFKEVKKGDMVLAFEESVFGLQETGDFSGLVNTPFGTHIIRLDKVHPVRIRAFKEVEKQLLSTQRKTHKSRVRNTYLNELGTESTEVSDEEIRSMVIRYFGEDQIQEDSKRPESE
jgi:parvulin-like peptidyl-prolyl isomerase